MHKIEDNMNSSRFNIPPIIHKANTIRFTDGSANPVSNNKHGNKPLGNSDSITSIGFDIEHTLDVISIKRESRLFRINACLKYLSSRKLNKENLSRLGGFGIEEMMELKPFSISIYNNNCVNFLLFPTKSMSLKNAKIEDIFHILKIIPIFSHFTLYVSEEEELRYISHQGNINIENQPIFSGIKRVKFRISTFDNLPGIIQILSKLNFTKNKEVKFFTQNILGKSNSYDLLLN